ncbi:amidase family protein [Arenibacter sp. GZD96]|uniref:amidase family protein n=1 Tax=Aurantibrevibacter litoralis TaxID=3106030 RepID=UPI002AFF5CDF|nr:amidase family protein [Arenibacter sp. GZD-96]MEA1786239.1 amidase family protein [Arenibacter sp. GZD-96]
MEKINSRLGTGLLMWFGMGLFLLTSCKSGGEQHTTPPIAAPENTAEVEDTIDAPLWEPYNDSAEVAANQNHNIARMRYKLIQSKGLDKNSVFEPLYSEVLKMTPADYERLKPFIIEQDIPTIQAHIADKKLNYETLVRFFLYRIYTFEIPNVTTLNTVIALNPNCIEQAKLRDKEVATSAQHPIFGMPILLKDNIGTAAMNTTAGAIALKENITDDAFVVRRLKENGAIILGKVNLSEWAYFFCSGCPVGYSAVGGQTLNPYGRRKFETGGSSSGSGTAVAANYAVAAVGTETSGSILSPSGQNSVVGLKPTVGLLSRTGIVPISSTLDTPGPMTKNVIDNGIVLDAMRGFDEDDDESVRADWEARWYQPGTDVTLKGKRFGVFKSLVAQHEEYTYTLDRIREAGGVVIEMDAEAPEMDGFISILNLDMKTDLPNYLSTQVKNKDRVRVRSVEDVLAFNKKDSLIRMPYGQAILDGILKDETSAEELKIIKKRLQTITREFFNAMMTKHRLDAVLSINNYHASVAAAAKFPALIVPMGYKPNGEPIGLTFIAKQYQEGKLYALGTAFEKHTQSRKLPKGYQ